EQGNPHQLTIERFRYPGHPPQSRETAILAICDAVEAASRTLHRPDAAAIDSLVQRIVYGKLHLGQLDESGLSMSDLRRISDSLGETIRPANPGRTEASVAAPPAARSDDALAATADVQEPDDRQRASAPATRMPPESAEAARIRAGTARNAQAVPETAAGERVRDAARDTARDLARPGPEVVTITPRRARASDRPREPVDPARVAPPDREPSERAPTERAHDAPPPPGTEAAGHRW